MKHRFLKVFVAISLILAFAIACATVPITGRKQLNLYPESDMVAMSLTQYNNFIESNKLSDDDSQSAMVKRVGAKISKAVETYFSNHGMKNRLDNFEWEFNLIEDDTPNAWCMPGGKVVIYTGILPYTKDETGLAVVMGHEIAHAVARHGNERMSQQMTVQLGGAALSVAVDEKPEMTQNIFMAAYGVGSQLAYMLPYSRTHETEADKLGLIFMAMAGYNPQESVNFWQRMSDAGGQKPPEFMSTHPSDQTRISDLRSFMPEAMKYFKNN